MEGDKMNDIKTRALLFWYAFGIINLEKYFTRKELKQLGLSNYKKKYNKNVKKLINS